MGGEWTTQRFGRVAVLVREPVQPSDAPGLPYIGLEHIGEGTLHLLGSGTAEDATSLKQRFKAGDILFGKLRPYFRKVVRPRFSGICSTDIWVVRPQAGVYDGYLFYLMASDLFVEPVVRASEGTKMPRAQWEYAASLDLPLPSLPEQRAIAHILGTLDDKIELNRRMSETLEAMAQALFKSWFVDFEPVRAKMEGRWQRGQSLPGLPAHLYDLFPDRLVDSELGEIPEGWEVGPLGRFFAVGLGGVWGEDEQSARASVEVRCLRGIDCHDLAEGRIPDVPVRWVSPKQAADRRMSDGTILIEGSGSFCGRSMIWRRAYGELLGEPVVYSNFCKRLDPLCTAAQATVCWMLMRQAYRDGLLQSFRTGTAFPNFDVHGALSNMIVAVPPAPVADVFNRLFGLSQRLDLMAQTRTLAALRDALLPRLISGELRVKDAERFLETASP